MEVINDLQVPSYEEWLEEFSRRLEYSVKRKKYRWKELVEESGISYMAIRHWRKRESMPTITNVLRIAEVLGCDPSYFLVYRLSVLPYGGFVSMEEVNGKFIPSSEEWLNEFVKKIRFFKKQRRFTWDEVAYLSGIHVSTIRGWVRKNQMPRVDNIYRIAAAFECDPAYLLLM